MHYTMTKPCDACPFLKALAKGFPMRRLREFASAEFPCHKTAVLDEDDEDCEGYVAGPDSLHCAGALIFLEKRGESTQMMRISERFGAYDRTKLDADAFKAIR